MTDATRADELEPEEPTAEDAIEAAEIVPVDPPAVAGALAVRERGTALVTRDEISVQQLVSQRALIQDVMQRVMKKDVHYGVIPGVKKPSLFKPGGEVLNVLFRLAPSYRSEKIWHDDGHLTVITTCTLTHIPTGLTIAEGEGLCTTRETRYAYRQGGRTCPACGATGTIRKSKFPPRETDYPGAQRSDPPGWYCHAASGGCGANYAANDEAITNQEDVGRVENPDLADTYNTVLKMGGKRAMLAAVLNGTAASDVFTQDVEDGPRATGGQYGDMGGEPTQAREEVTWDTLVPATQLHPQAPRGWKEVFDLLTWCEPSLDWPDIVGQAFQGSFGHGTRSELTDDQAQEAGRRLANAAGWLRDVAMGGSEFPPPTDEQIQQAFRWAFGVEVTIPVVEAVLAHDAEGLAAATADDDIPFGGEDDATATD